LQRKTALVSLQLTVYLYYRIINSDEPKGYFMTLSGTYTAIITPFNKDLSVDYGALSQLISWQIENGVEGLVPVGTTGESPTLETSEHLKVISTVVEAAAGRVQIIAGTGANSTSEALQLTKEVLNMGVDATLQVTPYYNKPSDEGLFRHFSAVADLGAYSLAGMIAPEALPVGMSTTYIWPIKLSIPSTLFS